MLKKLIGMLVISLLTFCLMGCASDDGGSESAPEAAPSTSSASDLSSQPSGPIVVDKASKTITVTGKATGQKDSSIHILVNEEGSNSGKAFFTTAATPMDLYNALVDLGGVPGNNINLDSADDTVLGSSVDVQVSVNGKDYDCYDLITPSEKRTMDVRFGGNIITNQEMGTGCLLCAESCPAGITSDAAYKFKEPMQFTPSDQMPSAGTEVTLTFTLDDTTMVVNKKESSIAINVESTGYQGPDRHGIVNYDGKNAKVSLFDTAATCEDLYNALIELGAQPGNNIQLNDAGGFIEGTPIDVHVITTKGIVPFSSMFKASEDKPIDMRFGGNIETQRQVQTGCLLCLNSCAAGTVSNAAYPFKTSVTYGPTETTPPAGSHVIVTLTVKK